MAVLCVPGGSGSHRVGAPLALGVPGHFTDPETGLSIGGNWPLPDPQG